MPERAPILVRYAVLHHEGVAQPHYDLLVESEPGSALMTWQLAQWPPATSADVPRLKDHRREYLTYEGPISGGRGNVKRVESGTCLLSSAGADEWHVAIQGGTRQLHFKLKASTPATWILTSSL